MATYLAHHGILGQKWGKRNGPPYPLEPSDHSAAEKKADYTKSLSKDSQNNASTQHHGLKLSEKQKKALVIGAAVVGTALVAYGGYTIYKNVGVKNLADTGKEAVKDILGIDLIPPGKSAVTKDFVEACDTLTGINPTKGKSNCVSCATATALKLLGVDNVTAKPDLPKVNGEPVGYDLNGLLKAFKGAELVNPFELREPNGRKDAYERTIKMLLDQGDGATGILQTYKMKKISGSMRPGGHEIAYRVAGNKVQFFESQTSVFSYELKRDINGYTDPWEQIFSYAIPDSIRFCRLDNIVKSGNIDLDILKDFVNFI